VNIIESLATWVDTLGPNLRSRSVLESELFHSRPDVKYMRFPECIIRYRVSGSGPRTLVLATDPPVVVEQYDKLIELLKNDFRVVVFEIPGFGFSIPLSSFRFDFSRLNDVVARFLRQLDFGPCILAFPCVAAYGAIDIAARFGLKRRLEIACILPISSTRRIAPWAEVRVSVWLQRFNAISRMRHHHSSQSSSRR
jgi:hypothetical protein